VPRREFNEFVHARLESLAFWDTGHRDLRREGRPFPWRLPAANVSDLILAAVVVGKLHELSTSDQTVWDPRLGKGPAAVLFLSARRIDHGGEDHHSRTCKVVGRGHLNHFMNSPNWTKRFRMRNAKVFGRISRPLRGDSEVGHFLSRPAAFELSWRTSDDFPVSPEGCSATKAGALPLQVCCFHGPDHCSRPRSRSTTSRRECPMRPGAGFSNKAQVGGGSPPQAPPPTHMQTMKKHPGPGTQGRPPLQSAAPMRPGVGCVCREIRPGGAEGSLRATRANRKQKAAGGGRYGARGNK
jgi:hypothetical protein